MRLARASARSNASVGWERKFRVLSMTASFVIVKSDARPWGRRVELLTVPYAESADATLEKLRAAFRAEGMLALVGAYTVGLDAQILDLLRPGDVPLVGPFTLDPGVEPEDAIVAGLGLNIDSQFVNIRVGYDAEIADAAMTHYGSVTLRMAFW